MPESITPGLVEKQVLSMLAGPYWEEGAFGPSGEVVTNTGALTLPCLGRSTTVAALDGSLSPAFVHDVDSLVVVLTALEEKGWVHVRHHKGDDGNATFSLTWEGAAALGKGFVDRLEDMFK